MPGHAGRPVRLLMLHNNADINFSHASSFSERYPADLGWLMRSEKPQLKAWTLMRHAFIRLAGRRRRYDFQARLLHVAGPPSQMPSL